MNKILVIQTAFLGDAVLTLPLIQEIKNKYPNYLIDVLAIPNTKEIFENSPFVNKVLVYDKRSEDRGIFALLKLGNKLKKEKYNLIFSPHRSFRTAILVLLSNVEQSIGFDNSSLKYVYKTIIKYNIKEHEVLRNLRLINFDEKKDFRNYLPILNIPESAKDKVNNYLSQNSIKNFICVAPGSVWETKKYPINYYYEIIKYFINKGYDIILTGSKNERELCDKFLEISPKVKSTAGYFSIIETIELFGKSKLLICNDSAPTHFGMVKDIKVLTLYCSTVAEFGFYPYNSKSKYLSYDNLKCKPCGIHGFDKCPINTFDCGNKLKPEIVIKEAEKLLDDF
jgi:heptosyltransferase-2